MKLGKVITRAPALNRVGKRGLLLVLFFLTGLSAQAAVLSGAFSPSADGTVVDLSAEGKPDWAHWGLVDAASFDHKAGVASLIGNVNVLGASGAQQFGDGLTGFSWNDGTPTVAAVATTTGLKVNAADGGFQLTVPADTTLKRLKIYAGVRAAQASLHAFLSSSNTPEYLDNSLDSSLASDGVYTLVYAADSAGQFVTVVFTPEIFHDPATGAVRLQAATLAAELLPTVAIVMPTNNSVFTAPAQVSLQADAADPDGAILKVEFFANGLKLGETSAQPYTFLWTNVLSGSYLLTAQATDNEGATALSVAIPIIVTTNRPPSAVILEPADETNFLQSNPITVTAHAVDPDGTVVKMELFDGTTKLTETSGSGDLSFTWNSAFPGIHSLKVRATDNLGLAAFSPITTVFVYRLGGSLSFSVATPPLSVNLTAEGTTDWAHWGLLTERSFNHKSGVAQQIGNYSVIGQEPAYAYADNYNTYSWTDGTPVSSAANTPTGVYAVGEGNGFEVHIGADATVRTLKLYVGTFAAVGKLQAYLSDFTAPVLFDSSISNFGNGPGGVYTIQFQAATPGQSLIVKYTGQTILDSYGNVTLQAATLVSDNAPPNASIVSPTNGAVFLAPANISIQASAFDTDGSISLVEILNSGTKLGNATGSPPVFLWPNVPAGVYSLQARVTDNLGATFLTQPIRIAVITGGGALSGHVAKPPASVDLSLEGSLDWTHWGLMSRNSFNHRRLVPQQIGDFVEIGSELTDRYANSATGFSWTNGTPVLSTSRTITGVFRIGLENGFQLDLPADRALRQLKLYVGLYGAQGRLEAALSDLSAAPYVDSSLMSVYGNLIAVYTFNYAAASAGQTLTVRYISADLFDPDYGNVTLQAGSLAAITGPRLSNPQPWFGGMDFSFPAQSNVLYRAQYTDSLALPHWTTFTNLLGAGDAATILDPNPPSAPRRFYRLQVE